MGLGTPLENVYFKSAMIQTMDILGNDPLAKRQTTIRSFNQPYREYSIRYVVSLASAPLYILQYIPEAARC